MNIAQYPLHHVPYASSKFEVAMFNGLWRDTFTKKNSTLFDPSPLGQGHKNIAQYPLHHLTNIPENEVAT